MDQCAAGATVAVEERVDGFELCMCDGCLRDRRQRVFIGERDEVGDQFLDLFMWRRDERSGARVVVASTNPVLNLAKVSSVFGDASSCKQSLVDLQK